MSPKRNKISTLGSANKIHRQKLNRLDKIAVWITNHVGSMGFFLIIFTWTVCWLSWNTFAPVKLRFDTYPGFILWLFISNMIQIFLMPLIMIGQNVQSAHAETTAEADYRVSVLTEGLIEELNQKADRQEELLHEIIQKIDREES